MSFFEREIVMRYYERKLAAAELFGVKEFGKEHPLNQAKLAKMFIDNPHDPSTRYFRHGGSFVEALAFNAA